MRETTNGKKKRKKEISGAAAVNNYFLFLSFLLFFFILFTSFLDADLAGAVPSEFASMQLVRAHARRDVIVDPRSFRIFTIVAIISKVQ